MSEVRRDSKNRKLQTGESQRPDGRYQYKYTDAFGEPKFAYSWKLVPTDRIPAGKRPDISLREKIKQIQKDLDEGIDTIGQENDSLPALRQVHQAARQCEAGNKKRTKTVNEPSFRG